MDYSLSKRTATVYGIRIKKPESTWADITIEEWEHGGSFKCVSDYGNYSYIWNSIGERNLREFLSGLSMDYFMGKATTHDFQEFDAQLTMESIRREILYERQHGGLTKDEARECWDEAQEGNDLAESERSDVFWARMEHSAILQYMYDGERCDVDTRERVKPQCKGFWDIIWPVACEIWRDELKQLAA